jgi:ABC-type uncharacterized transport system substrate-binding protein
MKILRRNLFIIILLLINISLSAHPHLFAGVDLDIDATCCDTLVISQRWMFDDLTSMIILEDFDTDGDGDINSQELADLKESVLPGLKEVGYYTDLVLNEEKQPIKDIYNFSVGSQDIYVYYKFDIKVPVGLSEEEQIIKLNIYDSEFYTKFYVNTSSGLRIIKEDNIEETIEVYENEDKAYYFGQLNPLEVKVTLRKVEE